MLILISNCSAYFISQNYLHCYNTRKCQYLVGVISLVGGVQINLHFYAIE